MSVPRRSARRVTMPRTSTVQRLAIRSSRPQQLQSEFLAPVAGLKGLCASFARKRGSRLAAPLVAVVADGQAGEQAAARARQCGLLAIE